MGGLSGDKLTKEQYEALGLQAFVSNSLVKKLRAESKNIKLSHKEMRDRFIAEKFEQGGKPTLERIRKWGTTERGDKLKFFPWNEELIEGLADFRFSERYTMGCSQLGKTLQNTLIFVDTLTYGRCNLGWFYASRSAMQNSQPTQFLPVLENYIANMEKDGYTFNRDRDRMQLERIQIEQITASFAYASTGRSDPASGLAAVGGAAASFTADICAIEERSQISGSAADPIPRRLDASVIPTKCLFIIGTPGAGAGIESDIKLRANYNFYPAFECPHCGSIEFLDPKGCLLKKFTKVDSSGNPIDAYLSESGRPQEWFHHDEQNALESAYIACPNCHHEIDQDTRLSARYRCKINHIWFRDVVDALPKGVPDEKINVAFNISPLLRETKINLAADIIKSGIEASSSLDYQQQRLGHPSELSATSLTMEILHRSIKSPPPERAPEVVLAGLDQGRNSHSFACASFSLPLGYKNMATEEVIDKTVRQYLFLGEIQGSSVPDKLKQYNVTSAFCDADPERRVAAEWQRTTVMKMAQQISGLSDNIKKATVEEGGGSISCYKIRNERFLSQVLLSFITLAPDGHPLARLPKDLEKWIHVPIESSPIKQLQNVRLEPTTGKWTKIGADHAYYACLYLETCFYHWLTCEDSSSYIPGALCTVESPVTSTYTPLGYNAPRGGRRGSFIPGSARRGR
jgi:hypothetical protein